MHLLSGGLQELLCAPSKDRNFVYPLHGINILKPNLAHPIIEMELIKDAILETKKDQAVRESNLITVSY